MRSISKNAGVTVGAIYNHFQTKEDIWREVIQKKHPYHEVLPLFLAAEGDTIAEMVQSVARGMVGELRKRPDLLNLMFIEIVEFQARHIPELFRLIIPELGKLQGIFDNKQGQLRTIPQEILVRSFIGLFFSYYVTDILMRKSGGFLLGDASLDQYVDLYLYGVLDVSGLPFGKNE